MTHWTDMEGYGLRVDYMKMDVWMYVKMTNDINYSDKLIQVNGYSLFYCTFYILFCGLRVGYVYIFLYNIVFNISFNTGR